MRKLYLLCIILNSFLGFSQSEVILLQNQIDSFERINKDTIAVALKTIDSLTNELKDLVDYQYYSTRLKLLEIEQDSQEREYLLEEVVRLPFWQVENMKLQNKFRELYLKAAKLQIEEYSGNLAKLKSLKYHAAYQSILYPFLKTEYELSGGIWDRGEIPQYRPDPPLESNQIKKQ